jgi:hypothetical protein
VGQTADIHSLAGAYALDAVDDIERAGFSRHLAECDTCALEVAELRETAARLADTAWEAPPPSLKANVLAEVIRTRQVGPAPVGRASAAAPARRRRWITGVAAAVVLAVGATTTTYVLQEQRVREAQQRVAAAQRIEAVLSAPDAKIINTPVKGGGTMSLVVSELRNESVVSVSDMPLPGADRTYQFWLLHPTGSGRTPTPAGTIADGESSGMLLVTGYAGSDAVGVTQERAGGAEQPSMDPLASLQLSQ